MATKEKILNGERFVCQMGDTYIHESKINNKEIKMNKKTAVRNDEKVVIASGIIKFIKTQHPDFDAATRCKLFATLYTMALKEKKELANA